MANTDAATATFSALEMWSDIVQTPELVNYFRDVFDKIGITIQETGEQFTVIHKGDAFGFMLGVETDVDCVVPLRLENAANLVKHARDGRFDPQEAWQIIGVLFTPLTRATLRHPYFAQGWLRRLAGVEDLIHVCLVDPDGAQQVCHTLVFAARQWLVIPGLHGNPQRIFYLTSSDALEFQRHIHRAIRENSMSGWWQFAEWYRGWRISVSEKHRAPRQTASPSMASSAVNSGQPN
jgi:hypothetical protein